MRRILSTLFMFSALTMSASAKAASCPSEGFIQSAGAAFMGAARNGSAAAFSNAAARFADLRGLALFALGPYRKDLAHGREGEYVALTKKFTGQFMAQYASKFSGNGITITNCVSNIVVTKLSTGQGLTFRLRGGSRIEDVSVSGIWLAQELRSKFTSVIRRNDGDVDALITWLAN